MAIAPGETGEAVRQLQHRLGSAGYLPEIGVTPDLYCSGTQQGVRAFQEDRGLTVSGVCDDDTWNALLEAWWDLGDRSLMLRSPNLRGDDVAELQRLLSRLGFDCGRIDGIFGQKLNQALRDFQLNAGLDVDGVCHNPTVTVLRRLSRMTGDGPGIAAVRDSEEARRGQPLAGRRVAVGQFGDFEPLRQTLSDALREHGAMLIELTEEEVPVQGRTANLFGADVYVGIESSAQIEARVAYYSVPAFESAGGRSLAHLIERHLRDVVPRMTVSGMRLPILRETKMPAVLLTLGPVELMTQRSQRIAEAIFLALSAWAP
jgi:N-acetylmuramoyl-L-alanine amidase